MFPAVGFGTGLWWIFPLVMIGMMVLCLFMMRGHKGSIMCRPGFRSPRSHGEDASESAPDILNERYARGEIGKEEYEEKKKDIAPARLNSNKNGEKSQKLREV